MTLDWNVLCKDQTDGTKWTMSIYATSETEARMIARDRIAPHVIVEKVVARPKTSSSGDRRK